MFNTRFVELILYKTYADLRAESQRTYLGYLWWALEPVMYMAVFYYVFGALLGRWEASRIPFLLVGLVAWKWFESSIKHGANSILANGGLMRQVHLPKYVFPTTMILADATKFLVAFVLLLVFLWIFGLAPGGSYAALPLTLALNFLLIVGLIYPIAAVMPFVPDLYVIVENLLRVLFFVSGVFFEIESLAISDKVKAVLAHNPLAAAIGAHRAILLEHRWPEWSALVAVGLPGAIGLVAGLIVMARYDRVYPRMVLR